MKDDFANYVPAGEVPHLDSIEQVSSGWINKYILHYTMPDGRSYRYESISRKDIDDYREQLERIGRGELARPDGVCIVPTLPNGDILLQREFRYPINSWCVALPAGLIDPGEDLQESIDRELREETGYRVRKELGEDAVRALRQVSYSSTGLGEENVQIVFAQVEYEGEPQLEPSELIETFVLKREEIAEFLAKNRLPIGTRCQLILEMLTRETDA